MATQFEIDNALMAGAAYRSSRADINRFPFPAGWAEVPLSHITFPGGFEGISFQRGTEIVISYAGTGPGLSDWDANSGLALGFGSEQLRQAAVYYLEVKAANPTALISFTGHSLGGGLAALMGVFFDEKAVTFDQAPFANSASSSLRDDLVSYLNGKGYSDSLLATLAPELLSYAGGGTRTANVTGYYVEGEALHLPPVSAFSTIGTETMLPQNSTGLGLGGPIDLHSQALLTAFLLNDDFRAITFELPDLLKTLFDEALYAHSTAPGPNAQRNFLDNLIRHQIGVAADPAAGVAAIPADGMLDRFVIDLQKLTPDTYGTASGTAMAEALVVAAMEYHYFKDAGATQLFTFADYGLHFKYSNIGASGYKSLSKLAAAVHAYLMPEELALLTGKLVKQDAWHIQSGVGGMTVHAGVDNDALIGGAYSDGLWAGAGNDILIGGVGNDVLVGEAGNDYLLGGMGNDTYILNTGDGYDTVLDSDGSGVIVLNAIQAKGSTGVLTTKWKQFGSNVWQDQQNGITYGLFTLTGGSQTLLIKDLSGNTVEVKGWSEGELGIVLGAGAPLTPTTTLTYTGDQRAPLNSDGTYNWGATNWAANGTLVGGVIEANFNDVIYASAGADSINGLGGNDALDGGAGDDVIEGGIGNDLIGGGVGSDLIYGGAGNDVILSATGLATPLRNKPADTWAPPAGTTLWIAGSTWGVYQTAGSNYTIVGGGSLAQDIAPDLVYAGAGDDLVTGGLGNDILYGELNNDHLWGGGGDDIVDGGDGDDILVGDGTTEPGAYATTPESLHGNDILIGGAGRDTLSGGGKDDLLLGGSEDDTLKGGEGVDYLDGGTHNDTLFGEGGDDFLQGGSGDDVLSGGNGNDILDGGGGADFMEGGPGDDTYLNVSGDDSIQDKQGNNTFILAASGLGAAGLTASTEIDGSGAAYVQVQVALDSGGALKLYSPIVTTGTTQLQFANGDALDLETLIGTTLATPLNIALDNSGGRLYGGAEADRLYGGTGIDTLVGHLGNDTLIGGGGNDTLDGGAGIDTLEGGAGDDTYLNVSGGDLISDTEGNNTIVLNATGLGAGGLAVSLKANPDGTQYMQLAVALDTGDTVRVDSPFFADGITTLQFANGNALSLETLIATTLAAPVYLALPDGGGRLYGGAGADSLYGGAGTDTLVGHFGNDTLQGGEGNDALIGGAGKDRLYGDGGDDVLEGGSRDDYLQGGAGNDTLDGGSGNDSLEGGTGADTYLFGLGSGQDTIDNYDTDAFGTSADTILLGGGLTSTNITLARSADDLLIKINGTADSLLVTSYFYLGGTSNSRVETIKFASGATLDTTAIMAAVLAPTLGNDTLTGYVTDDSIMGSDGNDTLFGESGNDTLDGGGGTDKLHGGEGDDNLQGGGGDDNWSYVYAGLYGEGGNDTLDGGAGNDYLSGGAGADTYLFGTGSGDDQIIDDDRDALGTQSDTIQLGAGLTPANITLIRTDNNLYPNPFGENLVISLNNSDDSLEVVGYFYLDGISSLGVEFIRFDDGTTWDYATTKGKLTIPPAGIVINGTGASETLLGGPGNDTVWGGDGNDNLDGGAGNDALHGEAGNDIYLFGRNSGKDRIGDYDETIGNIDSVLLGAGILTGDVLLTRDNEDLILSIKDTAASLRISYYFGFFGGPATAYQVEQIKFAAGMTWNVEAVKTMVLAPSSENDSLYGYASADTIYGLAGNDHIRGFAGNDTLDGGTGEDLLDGGEGNDTLLGGAEIDYLNGGEGDDLLLGQDGDDYLVGVDGNDTLDGGSGNDTYDGGEGADIYLFGRGSGQDLIWNGGFNDTILFGPGVLTSDVLVMRDGDALVLSLSGTDDSLRVNRYFYMDADSGVTVGTIKFADGTTWDVATIKARLLTGSNENDVLIGYANADTLAGLAGDDIIVGGAGNDILDGGMGNDSLYGGVGDDAFIVDSILDSVTESADEGIDTVQSGVEWALSANVENLTLMGSAPINGTGNELANVLTGNNAVNTLIGALGNDLLDGKVGADTLIGGLGNDTYVVDNLNDSVAETSILATEIDSVQSAVTYTLGANLENLTLTGTTAINGTGNALGNILRGNSSSNILSGLDGVDTVYAGDGDEAYGGAGNDALIAENTLAWVYMGGEDGDDTLTGGAGSGSYSGGLGNDTITGGAGYNYIWGDDIDGGTTGGIDTIYGGASIDNAWGGYGNDTIYGNDGNDSLNGQQGDDNLYGGIGNDALTGGLGNDLHVGGVGDDTYTVDIASDIVTENLDEGIDTVLSLDTRTLDANVENLTLTGTSLINGTGNILNNTLTGNSANNTLIGGAGNDILIGNATNVASTVPLTSLVIYARGTPVLGGYPAMQVYVNGILVQTFNVDAASYTAYTVDPTKLGTAADKIDVVFGNDAYRGDLGQDRNLFVQKIVANGQTLNALDSGVFLDNGSGAAAFDGINLRTGQETLASNAALRFTLNDSDTLDGGTGADQLSGGLGNDTYLIDNIGDTVSELPNAGIDTVRSSLNHTLLANFENLTLTGTAAINGTGNSVANLLIGNAGNNILLGDAGDDTLLGSGGNDRIDGGIGNDILQGGQGNDTYVVESAGDNLWEGINEGWDTVETGISYTLGTNIENLTLTGSATINGTGNVLGNTLTGNSANNLLTGGAGNDSLNGGVGVDTMIGGVGNDYYVIDNAGDIVTENAGEGIDSVEVYQAADYTLAPNLEYAYRYGTGNWKTTGNNLNNYLYGNAGNDTLTGLGGNDILWGGAGIDTLQGGTGDDTYYVDDASDIVTENLNEGTDMVYVWSSMAYTLAPNVEHASRFIYAGSLTGNSLNNTLTGSYANDTLIGGAGDDRLVGGAGTDILQGGIGDDTYVVDVATDSITENLNEGWADTVESAVTYTLGANIENLTLTGTAVINGTGNALANRLTGNSANNLLAGGAGDDTYVIDSLGDSVTENANEGISDRVELTLAADYTLGANLENVYRYGTGNWKTTGNASGNYLFGNGGNDTLIGLGGDDLLWGDMGADTMVGGVGNDTYYIDDASDIVTETLNGGTDMVYVWSSMAYTLAPNVENGSRFIYAGSLIGNALNNNLEGSWSNDILDGGAGADKLSGNGGNDTIKGGSGNDVYVLGRGHGLDAVIEADTTAGNTDVAQFLTGIALDQIWFQHTGNNLEASIIGTTDKLVIQDWYTGSANHVEQFKTADGKTLLDSQVQNLVNAMASFVPPAAGQTTLPPAYQTDLAPVIAANWQ